jgi:hypothetical protein
MTMRGFQKKVSMSPRPTPPPAEPSAADAWVENRNPGGEPAPMKRLTIDVPESLHRAIKSQCALRGTKISEEVRELLEKQYGKKS